MIQEARKSGIDIMGDVLWGTHVCQFYQSKEDLFGTLLPYFKAGLENNEFCIWITSGPVTVQEATRALEAVVGNLDGYVRRGQIEILDARDWHAKPEEFEADQVLQRWADKEQEALAKGFDGLRLAGNIFSLEADDLWHFSKYEKTVGSAMAGHRMIVICSYPLDKCGASQVLGVASAHRYVLVRTGNKWEFLETAQSRLTEEALRKSEARHRALIENAADVIAVLNDDGTILYLSPSVEHVSGYEPQELVGKDIFDFVHPDDMARATSDFAQMLQTDGVATRVELRFAHKDGSWRSLEGIAKNLLRDPAVAGIVVNARDVTERTPVEETLRLRSQEQEALLNIASVLARPGTFQDRTNAMLKVLARVGEADRVIFWVPEESGRGLQLVAACPTSVGEAVPMSLLPFGRGLASVAFKKRQPVVSNDCASDPRPELEWNGVNCGTRAATSLPVRANGHIVGIVDVESRERGHFTAERVRLLEAIASGLGPLVENAKLTDGLRRSHELYRSLVEATGSVVIRIDREGRRTFVAGTTHELYGRSTEEMQGGRFGDDDVPEDREKARALLEETFRTGKPVRGVVTRAKRGGEVRYTCSNWEPIRDADGNVMEVQMTSTDITPHIEAERRRMEAERLEALASMAGGIAHDISNVLAMVTLWGNIAQMMTENRQVKEALSNVMQAAADGTETLTRLRRFAEPKKPGKQEPVDLGTLVADCVAFTRPMWKDQSEAEDIYIEMVEKLEEVPEVMGNAADLREAVVNLIQNAIEAMPRGGTLTVRTYREGDKACVAVSDTGVGISEADLTRIFDPFYTTKVRQGSGLGLSAVRAVASAHGGRVHVRSLRGEGSTFIVALPIWASDTDIKEASEQPRQRDPSPRKPGHRVLVVDDEPLVTEALEWILTQHGYQVVAVGDGRAALRALRHQSFDLVLLDLGLPGMNGYRVAQEMKKLNAQAPIVLVTGWGDGIDQARIESIGVAGVTPKPFQPEDLLMTVNEVMEKRVRHTR